MDYAPAAATAMPAAAAAVPPPRVTHNYGGVQGLHLLTDAFSEEVERKLFRLLGPPADAQLLRENDSRRIHGTKLKFTQGIRFDDSGAGSLPSFEMENHPPELFKLTNLIRDSGLHRSFIHPNGSHGICYPPKANFPHHFDSRFKYGECVAGVSIGFPSAIYFHAADKRTQEENRRRNGGQNKQVVVPLPPRSIYIMSGDAFLKWKHGIKPTCYKGQALPSWWPRDWAPPSDPSWNRPWNPQQERRSITMRSSKHYSNHVLAGKIPSALAEPGTPGAENDPAALARRLDAQKQFPAKMIRDGKHKFDEEDEANCQRQAEHAMRVLPQLEYRARFTAAEAPWAGAAEAHARAHATGVGIEPTPEGCAYRVQARENVQRRFQQRVDGGTCAYRGYKPHKVAKAMHCKQRADLGGSDKAQEDADLEAAIAASLQSTPAVASPRKRPRTTAVGPAEVVDLAADSDDDEECGDDSTPPSQPPTNLDTDSAREIVGLGVQRPPPAMPANAAAPLASAAVDWTCPVCTMRNCMSAPICEACEGERPAAVAVRRSIE